MTTYYGLEFCLIPVNVKWIPIAAIDVEENRKMAAYVGDNFFKVVIKEDRYNKLSHNGRACLLLHEAGHVLVEGASSGERHNFDAERLADSFAYKKMGRLKFFLGVWEIGRILGTSISVRLYRGLWKFEKEVKK